MTSKITELKENLIKNFPKLEYDSSSGGGFDFPSFKLMPFDYLKYAENELDKNTNESRINCISHLKRAIDCEIDVFLTITNLRSVFQKKNLKFDKKAELLRAMNIVSARSLSKLNLVRNKLEHEYTIPDLSDIEVYFDLCSAFVSVVEGYIFMMASHQEIGWYKPVGTRLSLNAKYNFAIPQVEFVFRKGQNEQIKFYFSPDFIQDFAEAMRIFFLLCRSMSLMSMDRVLEEIKREPKQVQPIIASDTKVLPN